MSRSLAEMVKVYDDALPSEVCRQLLRLFEGHPELQQRNGAGQQAGLEDSAWTELDLARTGDGRYPAFFQQQIARGFTRYGTETALTLPISPVRKISELIIKKYAADQQQRFQYHFDALGAVSNRYLVFLWYLNDVAEGGETVFPDLDLSITPKAGRLLMFPPYWMFQHAGLPPRSGDKYIISTYAIY